MAILRNASLVSLFLLSAAPLQAVNVNIYIDAFAICNYPTGIVRAVGIGGVGPYTYEWSPGGATTESITGLPPGTYSVTVTDFTGAQATNAITLTPMPYDLYDIDDGSVDGRCFPTEAVCVMRTYSPGLLVPGPAPFFIDGNQLIEYWDPMTMMDTVWYMPYVPQGDGMQHSFTFSDANGCTGTITDQVGWQVEWPEVTVLDVQGACAGVNSGSITLQFGPEGHGQFVQGVLEPEDQSGVALSMWVGGSDVLTHTIADLPPGVYRVVQFMTMSAFLPSSGCQHTTFVTVPDLGNTCGNLRGTAFMDYSADCLRQGLESLVPATMVEVLPGPYYALTNGSGRYSLNVPLGSYTVEQQSTSVDDHCHTVPVPFTMTAVTGVATVDLPDSSLIALDAQLTAANGPARPGFQFQLVLRAANLTPATTGATSVTLTFDPLLSVVSTQPTGIVAGNTITWNANALNAFQERAVHVQLQVPPDIGLLGTTLNNSATLTTVNTDAAPANNTVDIPVLVTGAYDPNDKQARTSSGYSASTYYIGTDTWIEYTIRYQNTGTDTAFNVVITDTIAPELDLGTFQQGASSHPCQVDVRDGNVLRFAFYNIQLPDSNVNEPGSHGFVSFRIRPREPVLPGVDLANTANIFFDFNPPVITEPNVLTASMPTGMKENALGNLLLFPNPADDRITLQAAGVVREVRIMSSDGRVVRRSAAESATVAVPVRGLPAGAYTAVAVLQNGAMLRAAFVKL